MDSRKQFEEYISDNGKTPKAIEKFSKGGYKLIATEMYWSLWQEAYKAGHESMRDEAVEKCAVSSSFRAIEFVTKAIKEIQP